MSFSEIPAGRAALRVTVARTGALSTPKLCFQLSLGWVLGVWGCIPVFWAGIPAFISTAC